MVDLPGGRLNHLNPILKVSDLRASLTFSTEVLGFEHLHTFGDPTNFAIIGRNSHQIYLCEGGQGHPGTWLALFVSDQGSLYQRLAASDARIQMPYDGNDGEFRVEDPDGHVLRVLS